MDVLYPPVAGSSQSAETLQWIASFNTPCGGAALRWIGLKRDAPKKDETINANNSFLLSVLTGRLLLTIQKSSFEFHRVV